MERSVGGDLERGVRNAKHRGQTHRLVCLERGEELVRRAVVAFAHHLELEPRKFRGVFREDARPVFKLSCGVVVQGRGVCAPRRHVHARPVVDACEGVEVERPWVGAPGHDGVDVGVDARVSFSRPCVPSVDAVEEDEQGVEVDGCRVVAPHSEVQAIPVVFRR